MGGTQRLEGGSRWDLGPPLTPVLPAVVELCQSYGLGPVVLSNELLAFVTSKDLDPQLTPECLDAFEHEVGVPDFLPAPQKWRGWRGSLPPPCPRCWPGAGGAGGTGAERSPTTSTPCRSCIPIPRGSGGARAQQEGP